MKKHSIIPIFIPHDGCQNDCIFCNQKNITARASSPTTEEVEFIIERNLRTIQPNMYTEFGDRELPERKPECDGKTAEIAFFGGSFTGIALEEQNRYLGIAKAYKDAGRIDKIRLSTRPDYINKDILENLKDHGVDIIELGAQSFDDEVLRRSRRGHDSRCTSEASRLIKGYGFELGIQLMTGLPGDTPEKSLYSADTAVSLNPDMARIYPTVVLAGTELKNQLLSGKYIPFDSETMIEVVTEMYRRLRNANITVLRIGLKSTDLINESSSLIYGDYHPAFRELVEGRLAREQITKLMDGELRKLSGNVTKKTRVYVHAPSKMLSYVVGHKKENRLYLEEKYYPAAFKFIGDECLRDGEIKLRIAE